MTPSHTLADPRVVEALDRMFAAAARDGDTAARVRERHGGAMPTALRAYSDAAAQLYLPISATGGLLLYSLVRAVRPATVVEFGTSFGISTLYLAAAVRDNGAGRVIGTELSADKAAAARRTFAETGLDDLITVLEGDARETLAGIGGAVDFGLP